MDAFLTATLAVTLAEIGDKTQLLALVLTLRFANKPALVAGILVATLVNHGASAWLGHWLGGVLDATWGQAAMAISFIALGAWLLVPDKPDDENPGFDKYGAFMVALVLFFLAEIGDKTQVATVVLAAEFQSLLWVTLGTTLGMLIANVPVVYLGESLMRRIPMALTQRLAAALFIGLGVIAAGQLLA
ncbi:TMEM165/GDT1 family protein [Simiduia sp. 21SJ11W-1]|uniref:TMEM165/GDT1 family protein n=1 Tax=Simiduia sp. 21SJ11W-1 TaxID=2909669 RepID=UPI00209D7D2C|nr:TMEM165/GDT1 family protein [Simiduia sp. 21SJ11W-1]UTA47099.1 TMEM165/GDT1 family protein [Simiduia sp. 21SJ11W-1]